MKYLFIGLGSIGLRHLQNLRSLTKEPVIAYRTKLDSKLDKKYDITSYLNLDTAFKQKPDVAFITNPTSMHLNYALYCARRGCHLFIEKPIATSSFYLDTLFDITKEHSSICFVGYNYRFHSDLIHIKRMLDCGKLGTVFYAQVQLGYYLPKWHPSEDYTKSYAACADLGGGPVLTLSHVIDYIYWLFGDVDKVYCHKAKVSDLEISVNDVVSIILVMKSGVVVEVHLDYLQPDFTHSIRIVGERGSLNADLTDIRQRDITFKKELKHFLNCVSGKEEPIMTHKDIKDVMRIIDDINS